jgi:tetratricopeptide (TPR) repeat protein
LTAAQRQSHPSPSAAAEHAALESDIARRLKRKAAEALDRAIALGFDPPSILHTRGNVAMEEKEYAAAAWYFRQALQRMQEMRQRSKDVPISDSAEEVNTYNQLGAALQYANRLEEAAAAFLQGLTMSPRHYALRTNLGSLYRKMNRNDLARVILQDGIQGQVESGAPSAALLNNLGLLELDEGNYTAALTCFQRAVEQVVGPSTSSSSSSASAFDIRSEDGGDVLSIMRNNIQRAKDALARDIGRKKNEEL